MSANEKPMINRNVTRVSSDYVRRAAEFQAAIIADVAGRRGTLHGRIKPLGTHMKVAGPAVTVEVRPGDNTAIHAALAVAKPGDVIVVDGKGDISCALLGEIMATQSRSIRHCRDYHRWCGQGCGRTEHAYLSRFLGRAQSCGPTKFILVA